MKLIPNLKDFLKKNTKYTANGVLKEPQIGV